MIGNKKLLAAALCGMMLTGCAAQPANEEIGSAAESNVATNQVVTQIGRDEFPAFGGCSSLSLPGNLAAAAAMESDLETALERTAFYGSNEEAWQRLMDGQVDLILAYAPEESTQQQLEAQGITMQQVGTDALVFLAGDSQSTQSLTRDQIEAAYSDDTDAWNGYAAAPGSSSRQLFERIFGEDHVGVTVQHENETLTAACPHTAGTLCYTTYLSLQTASLPENTTIISVNGIAPNEQTLADGSYPFTVPYYIVCRNGLEENDPAMLLYRWLTSSPGIAWLAQLA